MKPKNSPARLLPSADRFLKKLALLFAFLPPLADTLILYPLAQAALANSGEGVLYQILSAASQLLGIAGFFAAVALAVYCVFADALSALGRVFALQGISYLVSVVFLRTLVIWLTALIDNKLHPVFALSNFTLAYLTDNDGMMLIWSAVSLFINSVVLMVLLVIVTAIALLLRRKQSAPSSLEAIADENGDLHPRILLCLRLTTLIYLIQALANQVYTTVATTSDWDAAELIARLASVTAPYFLIAIYAFIGYWLMQTVLRQIARKVLALCSSS